MNKKSKSTALQKKIIERKLKPWLVLRNDQKPPSGWVKAIRGALGMKATQLAARLGTEHSAILRFEQREAQGKVTLETLEKLAEAMNCQFIYAIVPKEPYSGLESILDERAHALAKKLVSKVSHTMRLEQQGLDQEQIDEQVNETANELKNEMGSKLWQTKDFPF